MLLDNVVVGNTVESIFYAFANDYYHISKRKDPPMFYRKLSVPMLGFECEHGAWNRLNLMMGLAGKRQSFDSFDTFRIEDNQIKISENNRMYTYHFEKCFIFDPTGVHHENKEFAAGPATYLVLDDFEVSRLGGKKESVPSLEDNGNFVNQMHFYTSDRIDGADYITDCVTESYLTREQLYDFDYSDTMARFVIERYLNSIGMYGTFMSYYKNGNPKYRKLNIRHIKRLVFEKDNNKYLDSDNVKFLNMNLKEIIDEASTKR